MKDKIIGATTFGPSITITDPLYEKICPYQKHFDIEPGEYICGMLCSEDDSDFIYIRKKDASLDRMILTDHAEITSGLIGFFENKPDYKQEEWNDLAYIVECDDNRVWLLEGDYTGFFALSFSLSEYDHGRSPIFMNLNNKGEINALKIQI